MYKDSKKLNNVFQDKLKQTRKGKIKNNEGSTLHVPDIIVQRRGSTSTFNFQLAQNLFFMKSVGACCMRRNKENAIVRAKSQSYLSTGGLPLISSSWRQAPWDSRPAIFFQLNTCFHSPNVKSSLTRGWVCNLQLLLAPSSAVILRSDSRGIRDHILLSQIRDSPNLEGEVPVFIFPRNRVAHLYSQALGSLFVVSYDSQGYGGGILTRPKTGLSSNAIEFVHH
jgi:hypothetical protein